MKRLLSLLISISLTIGACFLSGNISFVSANTSINADDFAIQVSEMISEYDIPLKTTSKNSSVQTLSAETSNNVSCFQTRRLIVKSKSKIDTLNAVSVISGFKNLWILQFKSVSDTIYAYNYYSSLNCVEYVEPDGIVKTSESLSEEINHNDNTKHLSWGPSHTNFDKLKDYIVDNNIELQTVTVAVLDTGVDHTHNFLKGRVEPTGFNSSGSGKSNSSMDDVGHGTHVAGIIADCTTDNVLIKPYKVLGQDEGSSSAILAGVYKAIEDEVDVINMSLTCTSSISLSNALAEADEKGIVLVAGAGNDGTDSTKKYPASLDFVIAVSAITEDNLISDFSNFGSHIDLAAPGTNIYSTMPNNKYLTKEGTSMATPFVSAASAMAKAYHGKISTTAVKKLLYTSATKISDDTDDCRYYGNGILNALGIINELDDSPENLIHTVSPKFNLESGIYSEPIEVELYCEDENAVIYYTTDGTEPNISSSIYIGTPIKLKSNTTLSAAALSENRRMSKVVKKEYRIVEPFNESMIEIDEDGYILSCSATVNEIIIPETVNGITVKGVRQYAFSNDGETKNVFTYIKLPDTVTYIENHAFYNNIYLEEIVANGVEFVGAYAFSKCSALYKISLNSLEIAEKYAFNSSGTSYSEEYSIELPSLRSLGERAFSDCSSLSSFSSSLLEEISEKAFYRCKGLKNLDVSNVKGIGADAFMECTALETIELPECLFLGESAFELCQKLTYTYLPKVSTMYTNSFNLCDNILELKLPMLTEIIIGKENFDVPNLKKFYAASLLCLPDYFFANVPAEIVSVPACESVGKFAFSNIDTLEFLEISSLESIDTNDVFYGTEGIEFIDAHNLKTAKSLPANSSILVSSRLSHIESFPENLTIFGIKGSYAESFANDNNYTFIPIPYIDNDDIPEEVSISETVEINAIGFDLTYQWYQSVDGSIENGVEIDGATEKMLDVSNVVYAPYYYCVVTCSENDKSYSSKTNTIKNLDYALADFKNVDYALSQIPDDLSVYTQESVEILNKAIVQVNRNTANNNQEQVDKWAEEIQEAIKQLVLKRADYSAIETAKAKAEGIDRNLYTSESLAKLDEVLAAVEYNLTIDKQSQVEETANAIEKAILKLEYRAADYSELDKALETVPDDLSIYTDESLDMLNDILDSIDKNLDITNQSQIDEWAKQVETAVKNLNIKPADYTALDEVISKIPDNLSLCTDESVAELEKVLNKIDRELDITQQEQVDNYVTVVEQAITNLNYKPADYSLVFDAVATIPEDLSIYTPESVDALESVIEGIDYSLDITQQEKVDEYAAQIKKAVENLEEECWLIRWFKVILSFCIDIMSFIKNFCVPKSWFTA